MYRLYSVRLNLTRSGEGNEVDEDGLTSSVLETGYEIEIPVNSWFV